MATVGDQLTQPEAGWRRYDNTHSFFRYVGSWSHRNTATANPQYNNTDSYSGVQGDFVSFSFTGSKIRIISFFGEVYSSNIEVKIDGISYFYNANWGKTGYSSQVLLFEKELSHGIHKVEVKSVSSGQLAWDAIDIDSTGELLSIPPVTTGKLCNTLGEMDIGDYIVWKYNSTNGYQFGGNIDGYTEIPVTGVSFASIPTPYFMYFIKVDTGLLISDRVFYHSRSWDSLNSVRAIQGFPITISGVSGVIRSLTGGVAYADEYGNKSLTNKGFGGFPINNEWDKYVVKFPSSLIQEGKMLDDIFHWSSCTTMTQDTLAQGFVNSDGVAQTGTNASTRRIMRGSASFNDGIFFMGTGLTTATWTNAGFRPIFEYKEV